MGFFDMGPLEIVFILIVALIIWGPRRIPEIARTLGRMVRTLRKATSDITATVNKELDIEERGRPLQSKGKSDDKTQESSPEGKAEPNDTETASPGD
jgi:Tat protein translocase TatB subunit